MGFSSVSRVTKSVASRLLFPLLVVGLLGAPAAHAQRVAVLHMADISQGDNAVNLTFTREVFEALQLHGFEVVSADEITRFMAENRVRNTGYLNAFLTRKLGRELGCTHVFTGAVTEDRGGLDPAFGFVLSAIDAESGIPVWGDTRATSLSEHIGLLRLGEPASIDELRPVLLDNALEDIQDYFARSPETVSPPYEVHSLLVSPRYLKSNEPVECRLRIRFLAEKPIKMALEVGGKEFPLRHESGSNIYRALIVADQEDGLYPVSLILDWGEGKPAERLERLGQFEIINQPPNLQMAFNKGLELDGVTVFRSHLIISSQVENPLKTERWSVEIKNEEGKTVVREEYDGGMPKRMVWKGLDSRQRKLADGVYDLSLHVWDAAGNHTSTTKKVALQTSVAGLNVSTDDQDGITFLHIQRNGEEHVPIVAWQLKAKTEQGVALLYKRGAGMPAVVEVPEDTDGEIIVFDFEAIDKLGNKIRLTRQEVRVKSADEPASAVTTAAANWMPGIRDF